MQRLSTDIVVVGSGIAGLYAAILCRQAGLRVAVCSKSKPGRGSCSALSQGHFRSSVKGFSRKEHRRLTLEAGQGLNREEMVDILVNNAHKDVLGLKNFGVQLGQRSRGLESMPERFGLEGLSITKPLAAFAASIGVEYVSPFFAWRIVETRARAAGICGFYRDETEPTLVQGGAVILASGGAGAVYESTDNPQGLTGDGYAMAYHAGLSLLDMEFVQFFPFSLASSSRTRRLVPPVVAEVGTLRNARQEDVVAKYGITKRPLAVAARDQLSLAMARELQAGLGVEGALRLDIPQSDRAWEKAGRAFGLGDLNRIKDWVAGLTRDKGFLLVQPAVHFFMGGLDIDTNCRTGIQGLLAAGEIGGGLHGANRYGGNALTETAVFARIAAAQAVRFLEGSGSNRARDREVRDWFRDQDLVWKCALGKASGEGPTPAAIRHRLQRLMWEQAGLIRSEESLALTETGLDQLREQMDRVGIERRQLIPYLEEDNRLLTARMVVKAARMRLESRGAHFREDYPETDPAWTRHISIRKTAGRMQLVL